MIQGNERGLAGRTPPMRSCWLVVVEGKEKDPSLSPLRGARMAAPVQPPIAHPHKLKRKAQLLSDTRSPKRQRRGDVDLNELTWKVVSKSQRAGVEHEPGMLLLEEVEGVDVSYELTEHGRVAKFHQVRSVRAVCCYPYTWL